jgi:hypothetical protein
VTDSGFVAYKGELRRFVNFYRDANHLLAWANSSSFGNFLCNVSETSSALWPDALDRLLESQRSTGEGIRLERYLLFATAQKPAN